MVREQGARYHRELEAARARAAKYREAHLRACARAAGYRTERDQIIARRRTAMPNRVLTLEEVLACPQGAAVWVEHTAEWRQFDGVHVARCDERGRLVSLSIKSTHGSGWAVCFVKSVLNKYIRVWSLPQPPTAEELSAWPWLKEGRHDGSA